jgi:uroporphyrinogen-III decarboxylase
VIAEGRAADAHILNLGHGLLPGTDPDVLTRIVELAHSQLMERGETMVLEMCGETG